MSSSRCMRYMQIHDGSPVYPAISVVFLPWLAIPEHGSQGGRLCQGDWWLRSWHRVGWLEGSLGGPRDGEVLHE